MHNVVSFRPRSGDAPDLTAMAHRIIAERSATAGWDVAAAARLPGISAATSSWLLALADEIARIQGYGWHFDENGSGLNGTAANP